MADDDDYGGDGWVGIQAVMVDQFDGEVVMEARDECDGGVCGGEVVLASHYCLE